MPDAKTPNTTENARQFLEALESPSKSLTYWEQSFIEDMADLVSHSRALTDRQFEILERIYVEKAP